MPGRGFQDIDTNLSRFLSMKLTLSPCLSTLMQGSMRASRRCSLTWMAGSKAYNEGRPHQGRWCFGKTPMQTFLDAKPLAKEKLIQAA